MITVNGKQPHEWDESDVRCLIDDEVLENQYLDYTESASLHPDRIQQITKEVTAFANADGGAVIYGIAERPRPAPKGVPDRIDGGISANGRITREWIDNILTSNVFPPMDGVRINQVSLNDGTGHVIYVVSVPSTINGPHQAADLKYYRRFETKSPPMRDYEIRDVMRRGNVPDLYSDTSVVRNNEGRQCVSIKIGNRSNEPALYAMIDVYLDRRFDFPLISHDSQHRPVSLPNMGRMGDQVYHLRFPWAIPNRLPIWEGNGLPLHEEGDDETFQFSPAEWAEYTVAISMKSPKMLPRVDVWKIHRPVMAQPFLAEKVEGP